MLPFNDRGDAVVRQCLIPHSDPARNMVAHIGINPGQRLPVHGFVIPFRVFLPEDRLIPAENAAVAHGVDDPLHVQLRYMVQRLIILPEGPGQQVRVPHLQVGGTENRFPVGRQPGNARKVAVDPHLVQHALFPQVAHNKHRHFFNHAVHSKADVHFRHAPSAGLRLADRPDPGGCRVEAFQPAPGEAKDLRLSFKPAVRRVHRRKPAELFCFPEQAAGFVRLSGAEEFHQPDLR